MIHSETDRVPIGADVMGVPMILIGRTDSLGATLLLGDVDKVDREHLTANGRRRVLSRAQRPRLRGRARARVRAVRRPRLVRDVHADMARRGVRQGDPREVPGKMLAYNARRRFN